MSEKDDPAHLDWCRNLMRILREGGTWGLPRSGLTFVKRGDALVLTDRAPHHESLPMTAAEWAAWQDEEFDECRAVFEAAGFEMISDRP